MTFPKSVENLVLELEKLPGIGRRTAERLAFHILRVPRQDAASLARAIRDAHVETLLCEDCQNVTERSPCPICSDDERDPTQVLVVEDPRDVQAFERAGVFTGRYHVLMGALNPAEGTEPGHLTVKRLVERLQQGTVKEVILATDPDLEGDGTALLVHEQVSALGVKVTKLARGLPAGSTIEHLNRAVLHDALEGRRTF